MTATAWLLAAMVAVIAAAGVVFAYLDRRATARRTPWWEADTRRRQLDDVVEHDEVPPW